MKKNKNNAVLLVGMLAILFSSKAMGGLREGFRVDDAPHAEDGDGVKSEPSTGIMARLRNLFRRAPKPEPQVPVGKGVVPKFHIQGVIEGESSTDDSVDAQDTITPTERARIVKVANDQGFTFFRRPTLKDKESEGLTEKQKGLLARLFRECKEDPKYVLKDSDVDGFSKADLKLVKEIFNTAKALANYSRKVKKAADFQTNEITLMEWILSKGPQIDNLGPVGYKKHLDDVISAIKLMKKTLVTVFEGKKDSDQKNKNNKGNNRVKEFYEGKNLKASRNPELIIDLQVAFNQAASKSPNGKALVEIGNKIIAKFQTKDPLLADFSQKEDQPTHAWLLFRQNNGLPVDISTESTDIDRAPWSSE